MSAADLLASAPSREPRSRHSTTTRVVIYGLLAVFAVIYLAPLVIMVMTSLKPLDEVTGGNMFYAPKDLTFEPWAKAWGTACVGLTCAGIKGYFWNSIKMVVPAVFISTVLGALNGYVLTKWRFPGHKLVFGMMLFACFIPFQSVLIPMAVILGKIGGVGVALQDSIGTSLGLRQSDRQPGSCARRLRPRLHHAVLPQLLRGVPDRARQGGDDRRRQLLPDLPPHPAAQLGVRSSSSPSSISSPTSGTTSCSARPSPPAIRAR